jgi:hypothetical protein
VRLCLAYALLTHPIRVEVEIHRRLQLAGMGAAIGTGLAHFAIPVHGDELPPGERATERVGKEIRLHWMVIASANWMVKVVAVGAIIA